MFNKKHIFILLLLIVGICAMSSVSAADNVADVVATDNAPADDVVTALGEERNDAAVDDMVIALGEEESDDVESQDVLASTGNDSALAKSESDEVLSGTGVPYTHYSISLQDSYQISATSRGTISYYLNPYQYSTSYGYGAYDFCFKIFQGEELVFTSASIASSTDHAAKNRNFYIAAKTLAPGTYTMFAVNNYDDHAMAMTTLKVKGTAVIAANNYNAFYNSGTRMPIKVTDKTTGEILKFIHIKAVFSNGKTSVTRVYTTSKYGMISVVPPVGVGTWELTLSSNDTHIKANAIKKTVVVKKSNVAIKAFKVGNYQGYYVTLKAIVKSQGNNVKEGIVSFFINGKVYKVNVKNGIATKAIKLSRVGTYKYWAIFNGANFNGPKKTYQYAKVLRTYATKLVFKKAHVYYRSLKGIPFNVYVRTTAGKIVPTGKVKIIDAVNVNRKGVAKFYCPQDITFVGTKFMVIHYFKKVATKILTVRYIPASKVYRPCVAKILFREFYRCTACGSRTSHSHSGSTYIVS